MEKAISQGELKSFALYSSHPPKALISVTNMYNTVAYRCLVSTRIMSTLFLGIPCHDCNIIIFGQIILLVAYQAILNVGHREETPTAKGKDLHEEDKATLPVTK